MKLATFFVAATSTVKGKLRDLFKFIYNQPEYVAHVIWIMRVTIRDNNFKLHGTKIIALKYQNVATLSLIGRLLGMYNASLQRPSVGSVRVNIIIVPRPNIHDSN